MGGSRSAAAMVLVATLLQGAAAGAQATYGSAPIGGRSALMGGTGIALGHDGLRRCSTPPPSCTSSTRGSRSA